MNKKKDMILKQVKEYVKNMQGMNDEFKEMNGNYEDKKADNKGMINQYGAARQKELNGVGNVINDHIG